MSRVVLHRSLPPLKKVLCDFTHFGKGQSHQRVILDVLREATKKLRSSKSQTFYSMREVADFFKVPLGTINRVYRILETEGIINRIRSSHTVLVGKEVLPREAVRGVVGLYVWMHSMILLTYTQTLVVEFEERMRRAGYVADIIFHASRDEETTPEFATRLLQHRLDAVVLHSPLPSATQNILSLRERGVRVLTVQRKDTHFDLPGLTYLQDYQPAYQKMAARWYEVGIRKALLCTPPGYLHHKAETDILKTIINQAGVEAELVQDSPAQLLKRVRHRSAKSLTALVFLDSTHSEYICNSEPCIFEQISRYARLAFCVGPIRIPYLQAQKIRADIVDFSPTEIASRLAEDICRLSVLSDGVCHTFVAHYYEQKLM